ncbi:MAG: alanine racemase [Bacteroidota bacterium]
MNHTSDSNHPTHAIINIQALRNNFSVVRHYVGERVGIVAVVKANAYGHGMEIIAREAVRNGAKYLGVGRVTEGVDLRKAGISLPILVFEIVPADFVEEGLFYNLDMTVCTLEEARQIESVAERMQRKANVHVKVDTGMGRLGHDWKHTAEFIEQIGRMHRMNIVAVYSHFATSEDSNQTFAKEQLTRFNIVLEEIRKRKIEIPVRHMANTGAIMSLPESHFDMVRPGIMLYGLTPSRKMEGEAALQSVMSLVSKVSLIKTVEAGTSVSYGRRYYTREKTCVATIPIGYGDGYSRLLTNKAEVLIGGKRYPSVGTITMDNLMIDLGLYHPVSSGDDVVLIGADGDEAITSWDVAEKMGTIPYEVTCLITPRVSRVVTD